MGFLGEGASLRELLDDLKGHRSCHHEDDRACDEHYYSSVSPHQKPLHIYPDTDMPNLAAIAVRRADLDNNTT